MLQWLTVVHGGLEGCAALYAAWLAGSVALLSFGLDSMVEVVSASIVLWRLASMSRGGKWSISERAGLRLVGVCFLLLGAVIATDALEKLAGRVKPEESMLGIVVAIISVVGMPFLAAAKRRVSGEIESHAMRADARQTDFCFLLALILLAGLAAYKLFGLWWVDSVAALAMVPILLYEGVQALRGISCGCCCP